MTDDKFYYDKVMTTEAEVQRIASEIDVLFRLETEEGKAQGIARQSELEAALSAHDEAVRVYENMHKTNRPNDVAKNFVPVSTTQSETEGDQPTVIKRQDYDKLSLNDRDRFVKSGGTIED